MYDAAATGRRLRQRRKARRLTQRALGEKIGVSDRHISAVENGRENPGFEMLIKLCDALDVTPDYLLLGSVHEDRSEEITDRLRLCGPRQRALVKTMVEVMLSAPAWPETGMMQIETRTGWVCVNKHEIVCVEAIERRVLIHMTKGCHETKKTIDYWEDVLDDPQFYRVHRSYIVNLFYVTAYDRTMICLKDGDVKAYLSRRRFSDFHKTYTHWAKTKGSGS